MPGDAAAGVVLAIAAVLVVTTVVSRFPTEPWVGTLASYLAVWVPLGVFVVIGSMTHGTRSIGRDFEIRFRAIDVLWGLTIGVVARVAASVLEIAVYGRMASGGPTLGTPVHDGWWVFGALLAPVLIAPFVEELFFRGLLLRGVDAATRARGASTASALGVSVAVSGIVFALVHVLQAQSVGDAWVTGLSTLLFGLAAASVAALTGRLGGAFIAHVTFNALVVVPAVLPGMLPA